MAKRRNYGGGWRGRRNNWSRHRRPAGQTLSYRLSQLEQRLRWLESKEGTRSGKEVKRAKLNKVLAKQRLEAVMSNMRDRLRRSLLRRY